jgi:hypothetical protein
LKTHIELLTIIPEDFSLALQRVVDKVGDVTGNVFHGRGKVQDDRNDNKMTK